MTTYQMSPKQNGTRLRKDHTTFAATITSYNAGQVIEGDEMWTAPADGSEVKKGDEWMHVTQVNGVKVPPGWMARIHKGVEICVDYIEIVGEVPQQGTPEWFDLIAPDGTKARYVKA